MSEELGQCFQNSAHFMLEADPGLVQDLRLVHAVCVGQGPIEGIRFAHAWVELAGKVAIDVTDVHKGKEATKLLAEQYRRIGQVSNVVEYTRLEMVKELVKHTHYGPWDPAIETTG
jgi:hypothetical protein